MSDTITEEIVLDETAQKALVEKTAEAVKPAIEEAVKSATEAAIEEAVKKVSDEQLKNTEEIERKAVEKAEADRLASDPIAKGVEDGKLDKDIVAMSPAMRFFNQMKALVDGDSEKLRAFNKVTLATQLKARGIIAKEKGADFAEKAGYNNEATQADGSVLVPDAEFVTTVYDNLPKYGVALREADVRQTDRTSVRVISLDDGLVFYNTAEAGVKTSAKLSFSKNEVSLQKYAVIVPATDELTEDAAVDYWNLVTRELSRGYARKADEVVFTDASTGITNLSGVITTPVSGAGTTIKWEDLLASEGKTEDDLDESNSKWYMRKETWFRLIQKRADSGFASGDAAGLFLAGSLADGWIPNPTTPTTPWGRQVVFTRVLPTSGGTTTSGTYGSTVVPTNDAFAVYGDLKNYILYNKNGMALKMLTEATIIDQGGATTNLATQDISAMRAVIRLLGICAKGNRGKFVVVGTGTVS
jgi:HK97 family phage major capsid protein